MRRNHRRERHVVQLKVTFVDTFPFDTGRMLATVRSALVVSSTTLPRRSRMVNSKLYCPSALGVKTPMCSRVGLSCFDTGVEGVDDGSRAVANSDGNVEVLEESVRQDVEPSSTVSSRPSPSRSEVVTFPVSIVAGAVFEPPRDRWCRLGNSGRNWCSQSPTLLASR